MQYAKRRCEILCAFGLLSSRRGRGGLSYWACSPFLCHISEKIVIICGKKLHKNEKWKNACIRSKYKYEIHRVDRKVSQM